jgi:hypothetical protein
MGENSVVRNLALGMAGLFFAMVVGFEAGSVNAYAAKVNCDKVMSEVNSGKKAKEVATDLSISTSSVYRCKKKAASAGTGTKMAGGKSASPAASPAAVPSSTPGHK